MPKRRAAWSSWTYLLEKRAAEQADDASHITMSYWMNRLQSLDKRYPLIETLNPARAPDPALIYDSFEFEHPIFDREAVSAQERIPDIQGTRNTWYCGAWQRNGFHEDGLWSAVRVAVALDAEPAWDEVELISSR
jgi:predicted NAD/FAD-binding protein